MNLTCNNQSWRAIYYIHHVRHEMWFDTLQEAFDMLEEGSEANELSIETIVGPDGYDITSFDWSQLRIARDLKELEEDKDA